MIKQFLSLIISALLLASCSSSKVKNNVPSENSTYQKVAVQKYLSNIKYLFSPDSAYVVCMKQEERSAVNNTPQLKFFIYNLKTNEIAFEDDSRTDSVEWIDNSKLKVSKRPGIVSVKPGINNKLLGYVYDLTQHRKTFLDKTKNLNSL